MLNSYIDIYNNFGININGLSYAQNATPSDGLISNPLSSPTSPSAMLSGASSNQQTIANGWLQSGNFVTGSAGWQIKANGDVEFNSGTFRATISGATIIGGVIETNTSSSTRMVILGSDNTLTFYNSSNAIVTQLGGGANVGIGLRVFLDATTATGGRVTTSQASGIGWEFVSSGNYSSTGINVQLTGATGSGTGINVNNGHSTGESVFINNTNGAKGISIQNSGAGVGLQITSATGAGESLLISHSEDTTKGLEILYDGRTYGVYIQGGDTSISVPLFYITGSPSSATVPVAEFNSAGNLNAIVRISQTLNSSFNTGGLEINMTNAGSGKDHALSFLGDCYVSAAVGGTQNRKIRVLVNGATYYIPAYDA